MFTSFLSNIKKHIDNININDISLNLQATILHYKLYLEESSNVSKTTKYMKYNDDNYNKIKSYCSANECTEKVNNFFNIKK